MFLSRSMTLQQCKRLALNIISLLCGDARNCIELLKNWPIRVDNGENVYDALAHAYKCGTNVAINNQPCCNQMEKSYLIEISCIQFYACH